MDFHDLLSRTRQGDEDARRELFDSYGWAAKILERHYRCRPGLLERLIELHHLDTIIPDESRKRRLQ